MTSLAIFAFSVPALLMTMPSASALSLDWDGSGTSGSDPLGHTWILNDQSLLGGGTDNAWGIPGLGEGVINFAGGDWVTDLHVKFHDLPAGCAIDPTPAPTIPGGSDTSTRFSNLEDSVLWDRTIMGDTVWFVAADPVADRLDPTDSFFVNVAFDCSTITEVTFSAFWSMGPVGGEYSTLDSTALLVSGIQSNSILMLPALAMIAAGIGIFVTSRKN